MTSKLINLAIRYLESNVRISISFSNALVINKVSNQ